MKEITGIDLDDGGRHVRFKLSDDIVIEKRVRYSVWDLLGDVGGFNDGLIFVC